MKQSRIKNSIAVLFGLVVVAGTAYAAGTWNMPTASAPSSNVPAPIHTGWDQMKDGGISVGPFAARGHALFDQNSYIDGTVFGGLPGDTDPTVLVATDAVVAGDTRAAGAIVNGKVANTLNSPLCADKNGMILICGSDGDDDNNNGSTYIVPAQSVMHAVADQDYDSSGNPMNNYFPSFCLSDASHTGDLNFTIRATAADGSVLNQNVIVPAKQLCGLPSGGGSYSLNGPHTKVGPVQSECLFWTPDPHYQSEITVAPSLRCGN